MVYWVITLKLPFHIWNCSVLNMPCCLIDDTVDLLHAILTVMMQEIGITDISH